MKNHQRIANLATFRTDQARILVTTDLTSRGLDIEEVHLVVNYNLPRTVSDYVHRVGRTARKGLSGEAISLVTPNEVEIFQTIEQQVGTTITAHDLNEKPDLELVSKFNRAKREVKIHLMSCGVLEELEKRRQRKLQMR
jgi:ATP-dependent RNA helicase DDX49/DBP8